MAYPATHRDARSETLHGVVVADPYRWLERESDPEVQRWITDQQAFARAQLDAIPARRSIAERLQKLLYSGSLDFPKRAGTRCFFTRLNPGQEHAVLYVRAQPNGTDRALIDPNLWPRAEARAFQGFWPSQDGHKLVFATSVNNNDLATFQVLDVDSGAVSDEITGIYDSNASWSAAGDGFYYRWSPSEKTIPLPELPGHAEVRFHKLGLPTASDRTIRPATGDPHVTEYVDASSDGHWLLLHVQHGFTRQDVLVTDLRQPGATWTPIANGSDVWTEAFEANDSFYLTTNDGAPRRRLVRVNPLHPESTRRTEIVRQRSDATLVRACVVGGRLVLLWRKDDISELETRALDGSDSRPVSLPGVGFLARLSGSPTDTSAFATFESYTVPVEILEIDPSSSTPRVWQRVQTPINPDDYITEETFFSSKDGTRIPMFIVHRRDALKSGAAPTVYWGYGGFGVPLTLQFDPTIFAWLDRGGVYAEAAVRGGGDYGEDWHRAGMRTHKQNVIDDYIAGANALIEWKWTNPDRLMACGGSNGGLLAGAAITQRPDLFRAAYISAPLLDMVRYPLVGNGEQWTEEYGSPEDPADLKNLLSYSPYHNVKARVRYPSVLLYSPADDNLVHPMHARKFAAALQWATSGGPVLLSIAKAGGHFGPAGVEPIIDRYADAYAFGLRAMGLDQR